MSINTCLFGDCRDSMRKLIADGIKVQTCVTSPPYFGLRDYGHPGQLGLEATPQEYVANMVEVFGLVRELLRDDGTLFLNLGDSYFSAAGHAQSYGSVGKAKQGFQDHDSSSQNPCDERTNAWWMSISDNGFRLALGQVDELLSQTRERMSELTAHLASAGYFHQQQIKQSLVSSLDQVHLTTRAVEQLRALLVSKPFESAPQPRGGFRLSDMILACLSSLHALSFCVHRYVRRLAESSEKIDYMKDNALLSEELVHHIRCTDGYCLLVSSWLNTPKVQPHCTTLKPKDLIGIPWRVAFALQEDGWYLRQDLIWAKPNPMPESVTDRCTKSHEYIFLLSKSERYYYDHEAIKEPIAESTQKDGRLTREDYDVGRPERGFPGQASRGSGLIVPKGDPTKRNKRSVWEVPTQPYSEAHFATFPPALIEPCILAGSRPGDTVFDPFLGSGTTAQVSQALGRNWLGCELNEKNSTLQNARTRQFGLSLETVA